MHTTKTFQLIHVYAVRMGSHLDIGNIYSVTNHRLVEAQLLFKSDIFMKINVMTTDNDNKMINANRIDYVSY